MTILLETYEDASQYYSEVLELVKETGSQTPIDEHNEVCHIMRKNRGQELKALCDKLFKEVIALEDKEGLQTFYDDALDNWSNLHSWINRHY